MIHTNSCKNALSKWDKPEDLTTKISHSTPSGITDLVMKSAINIKGKDRVLPPCVDVLYLMTRQQEQVKSHAGPFRLKFEKLGRFIDSLSTPSPAVPDNSPFHHKIAPCERLSRRDREGCELSNDNEPTYIPGCGK